MSHRKQAVVVIHGIGEQRPMDTLREFVDAVLPETPQSGGKGKYWSRPDRMNETFELRCLRAPKNHQLKRPATDFYEYYWAHHMRNSQYSAVFSWLLHLLSKPIAKVPKELRFIYVINYALLVGLFGMILWGVLDPSSRSLIGWLRWAATWLLPVFQFAGNKFILGYVADAARYLTPSPGNIEARNKIRSEGINLIRKLHDSGQYFRIIIVGHSLGSVIGYDIIRNLWDELRTSQDPKPVKQDRCNSFDDDAAKELPEGKTVKPADADRFQGLQHDLWREHRDLGIPWLVTDFITLGSPLTYADFLLADSAEIFAQRKRESEYPCCPPESIHGTHYHRNYAAEPHMITLSTPNNGAPFAPTRWTNLYFPCKRTKGDFIGGPVARTLGRGVKDIPVGTSHNNRFLHCFYWKPPAKSDAAQKKHTDSLTALRQTLQLGCGESLEDWPDPTRIRDVS